MTTDQTGAVASDVLYYPWGRLWANYNWSNGNTFGNLQYQVNYPLPPSATRDYNPSLGRWLTPDKMGGDITDPQSLNRYAYALNNPATLNDPLGLQADYTGCDPAVNPNCYGGGCSNAWYADSHAECGGGCEYPLDAGSCYGYGYGGGGGNGGGGGGGVLHPVRPIGQPPLVGGPGNALQPYPTPIILNWPWIIRVTAWGLPYLNGALLASFPLMHLGLRPVADHPTAGTMQPVPTTGTPSPSSPAAKFTACTAANAALLRSCLTGCARLSDIPEIGPEGAGTCGAMCGALYFNRQKFCKKIAGVR